jgi:hypothetical protein
VHEAHLRDELDGTIPIRREDAKLEFDVLNVLRHTQGVVCVLRDRVNRGVQNVRVETHDAIENKLREGELEDV